MNPQIERIYKSEVNPRIIFTKLPYLLVIFFALIFTLIIGTRSNGPDFEGYLYYYDSSDNLPTYLYSLLSNFELKRENLEVTFFSILSAAKGAKIPFGGFLFIISAIQLYLLVVISSYTKKPYFFILGYILLLMFYLNGWYIRQGLGILFGLLAWLKLKNKEKSCLIYLFLSLTSHNSLLVMPFLIIFHDNLNKWGKLLIILMGLTLYLVDYSALSLLSTYEGIYRLYLDSDYSASKIGVLHILIIILYTFLLIKPLPSLIDSNGISMTLLFCFIFVILYGNGIPLLGRMVEFILLIGIIFLLQDFHFPIYSLKKYVLYSIYIIFCIAYAYTAFVLNDDNFIQIKTLISN